MPQATTIPRLEKGNRIRVKRENIFARISELDFPVSNQNPIRVNANFKFAVSNSEGTGLGFMACGTIRDAEIHFFWFSRRVSTNSPHSRMSSTL